MLAAPARALRDSSVTLALLLTWMATTASAQGASSPPSQNGLHATAAAGTISVSVDDAAAVRRAIWRLEIGWRFDPEWLRGVDVTQKLGLGVTGLRGIDPQEDTLGYSSVGFATRAVATRHHRLRPYLEGRWPEWHTAEIAGPSDTVSNYLGRGWSVSVGIEVPITPQGRGLDISLVWSRGRFTSLDTDPDDAPERDVRHTSVALLVGWFGRFTGISLPWR